MVNAVKYQLELVATGNDILDEDIARIGKALAEGAEISVTDDTKLDSITVSKLNAEVTKVIDLMDEEPAEQY